MKNFKKTIWLLVLLCMSNPLRAGIIAYTHDSAGRLTAISYGTNKTIAYTYTAAGDLTQRQFSAGTPADSDGDGMDDAWEQQYFGNLSRDGTGDFDSDGMSDLAEFMAGTLPNHAASVFEIIRVTPTPGVSALIEWTSVPGKTYRVQYKNSLSTPGWSDLPGDVTATNNTTSKVDETLGTLTQRFYRVLLSTGMASRPVSSASRTPSRLRVSWLSSSPASFAIERTNLRPAVTWVAATDSTSGNGTDEGAPQP